MQLTYLDLGFRLGAAALAGLIIGIERESHGRAAGLRTTLLVCIAACIAMLISATLFNQATAQGGPNIPDPARLAAGVLSGMGFLGAGSIIRNGNRVQGITTAATLWFVTLVGLAFGAGQFIIGGAGVAIAFAVLFILPPIERQVKNDWYATVTIVSRMDGLSDEALQAEIEKLGTRIKRIDLDYNLQQQQKTVRCELKFKKDKLRKLSEAIVQRLIQLEGVLQVSWA
ncbi:MAG: MgtC/SapB family protein [Anaerolineae bacterium]|nr:MgtC/SapB family protein [Anaerolineae bacterium]